MIQTRNRIAPLPALRTTATRSGVVLTGTAIVFNARSQWLGFYETIDPGALDKILSQDPDIRCLVGHNSNLIVARTSGRTLRLFKDKVGLHFEASLPDTSIARDLAENVRARNLQGCSFSFEISPGGDYWGVDNQQPTRRILEIALLPEITFTAFPAYPQTSVSIRK